MVTVKVSSYFEHDYLSHTPSSKGEVGNIRFIFDNSADQCDIWIVWGGVRETETVICRDKHVVFLTEEAFPERYYSKKFLESFDVILSCQSDIHHRQVIKTPFIGISQLDSSYDEISVLATPVKSKELSVICSDLFYLPMHRKRQAFVNALYGHFKQRIDLFGRGVNPIPKKEGALIPYKYSVVIENDLISGYHTEKLTDCYLTYTMPIYCGDDSVGNLYPENSLLKINISDFEEGVAKIESAISKNLYQDALPAIVQARENYLYRLHPFARLAAVLEKNFKDVLKLPLIKRHIAPESTVLPVPYEFSIRRNHKLSGANTIYTPDMGFVIMSRSSVTNID